MKKLITFSTAAYISLMTALPAAAQGQINLEPTQNIPTNTTIGDAIRFIINGLVVLGIVAALIFLILGGVKWVISGGDKAAVEAARNTIIAAVIGLVVVLLAWVVLNVVLEIVGIGGLTTLFNIPTLTNPG